MKNHDRYSSSEDRESRTRDVTVQGITVRLIFAAEQNREVPAIVRNLLKGSYLQRQGA